MLYNNIARTEKNSVNNILHVLDAIIYAIRDQILILYIHSMQVDLFCLARYRLCARLDILISIQSVMNLSIYHVLKDIEFLPLISFNESLEYSHQVPVDFKRPFQENPGWKPPPSIVRSHQRSPEWLNHLVLVRQLTNA